MGFGIAVLIAVQKKRREPHYEPPMMGHSVRANGFGQHHQHSEPHLGYGAVQQSYAAAAQQRFEASYQNMGGYQIPSKHKDITYCVIDERLVDNN